MNSQHLHKSTSGKKNDLRTGKGKWSQSETQTINLLVCEINWEQVITILQKREYGMASTQQAPCSETARQPKTGLVVFVQLHWFLFYLIILFYWGKEHEVECVGKIWEKLEEEKNYQNILCAALKKNKFIQKRYSSNTLSKTQLILEKFTNRMNAGEAIYPLSTYSVGTSGFKNQCCVSKRERKGRIQLNK